MCCQSLPSQRESCCWLFSSLSKVMVDIEWERLVEPGSNSRRTGQRISTLLAQIHRDLIDHPAACCHIHNHCPGTSQPQCTYAVCTGKEINIIKCSYQQSLHSRTIPMHASTIILLHGLTNVITQTTSASFLKQGVYRSYNYKLIIVHSLIKLHCTIATQSACWCCHALRVHAWRYA